MDEPWPDDILTVSCLRAADTNSVVPGSLVKTCWRCEASIWISPATLDHVRNQPHRLVCMQCALEVASKDDDPKLLPPTADQLKELAEALGLEPPEDPDGPPKADG